MKSKIKNAIRPINVDKIRRGATRWFRTLPDFLIVGAQRAGTKSLYEYLGKHDEVKLGRQKESDFFSLKYEWGVSWYKFYFPYKYDMKGKITGESCPNYLFLPKVPKRIKKTIPKVKIIILLRDPVERAESHYRHNVARGEEKLSFYDALRAEEERLKEGGDYGKDKIFIQEKRRVCLSSKKIF